MKKPLVFLGFLVLAGAVDLGPFEALAEERKPTYNWERFREIAERNIFSRSRTPRIRSSDGGRSDRGAEAEEARARMSGPDDPGRNLILMGVSKIGARYYAFFENVRDNTISSAATGDTIANRKITAITLDKVEYQAGEKPASISVGTTLTGEKVQLSSSSSGSGSGPGSGFPRGPGSRGSGERFGDRGFGDRGSRVGPEVPAAPTVGSAAPATVGPAEGEAKSESKTSADPEDILERLRRRREEEASK